MCCIYIYMYISGPENQTGDIKPKDTLAGYTVYKKEKLLAFPKRKRKKKQVYM
jgi:hypothetical protein